MLETPSLETQANFIREVYRRNRPDEIKRMNEALKDPELDPSVKELILKIRDSFKAAEAKSENDVDDIEPQKWAKGGRRASSLPSLALIDGGTDVPGYSEEPGA